MQTVDHRDTNILEIFKLINIERRKMKMEEWTLGCYRNDA